jgi:hypothetical protein
MQNDVETRVKNLRGFFPWKPSGSSTHPRRPSIASILYLKFVEAGRSPPFLSRAEFIPANKVAFQAATESIFTHPLMRHHKKYVASKNPNCTDIDIKGLDGELPLKMPEIFAPDLAAFYQYAIEQHCLNHTHVCTYSLKDISKVSLTDMQWYMGAPVTANLSTGSPLRGLNVFIVPEAFAGTGVTFGNMLNKVFERVDMSRYLLRLSVEIECEGRGMVSALYRSHRSSSCAHVSLRCLSLSLAEVFAITDAESGEVLQGDLTPRRVTHQVMLVLYTSSGQ